MANSKSFWSKIFSQVPPVILWDKKTVWQKTAGKKPSNSQVDIEC